MPTTSQRISQSIQKAIARLRAGDRVSEVSGDLSADLMLIESLSVEDALQIYDDAMRLIMRISVMLANGVPRFGCKRAC